MTLYIIAGANGSGKTTFAKEFSKNKNLNFNEKASLSKKLKQRVKDFDINSISYKFYKFLVDN